MHTALALAAIFAAWASYRIHIIPIESDVLPILQALVDLNGRAPDQYRFLPYFLIGLVEKLTSIVSGADTSLRYAVLVFDAAFLYLSISSLHRHFSGVWSFERSLFLCLIYPLLMFDGYRPIASFILLIAIYTSVAMRSAGVGANKSQPILFAFIVVLSFTRADVAFLFAVACLALPVINTLFKGVLFISPLAIQALLSRVVFPEAEYFSPLIMLSDNLSLRFIAGSPLTYLILGSVLYYRNQIRNFLAQTYNCNKFILIGIAGYTLTLFVIARPNEYRLFLPVLPLILLLTEINKEGAWQQAGRARD